MKRIFKLLIIALCTINIMPIQAIFYQVDIWKDAAGNKRIFCYDRHVRCNDKCSWLKQRNDIIDFCTLNSSLMIAEDGSHYTGDNANLKAVMHEKFLLETPLRGLIRRCSEDGIPHVNIEFRHAAIRCKDPKLNIPLLDSAAATNKAYEELESYSDNDKVLQEEYQIIKETVKAHRRAAELKYKEKLAHKHTITPEFKRDLYLQCAFECNTRLIDARILHELATYQKNESMVVCAGANHIRNITPVLQKMGYRLEKSIAHKVELDNAAMIKASSAVDVDSFLSEKK